jgi:hypothetical protein
MLGSFSGLQRNAQEVLDFGAGDYAVHPSDTRFVSSRMERDTTKVIIFGAPKRSKRSPVETRFGQLHG